MSIKKLELKPKLELKLLPSWSSRELELGSGRITFGNPKRERGTDPKESKDPSLTLRVTLPPDNAMRKSDWPWS